MRRAAPAAPAALHMLPSPVRNGQEYTRESDSRTGRQSFVAFDTKTCVVSHQNLRSCASSGPKKGRPPHSHGDALARASQPCESRLFCVISPCRQSGSPRAQDHNEISCCLVPISLSAHQPIAYQPSSRRQRGMAALPDDAQHSAAEGRSSGDRRSCLPPRGACGAATRRTATRQTP